MLVSMVQPLWGHYSTIHNGEISKKDKIFFIQTYCQPEGGHAFILYIVCKLDEDEQNQGSSLGRDCLSATHEALCVNTTQQFIYYK